MFWGLGWLSARLGNYILSLPWVMNFQEDPGLTLTPLGTRGQCLCVPHSLAGHGDTEGMEFADTGQLRFEQEQTRFLKGYVFRRTPSPAPQGEHPKN